MDEEDELFAFLTFFKICRMYQGLNRPKPTNNRQRQDQELQEIPSPKKLDQRIPETKKNFAMFSPNIKKAVNCCPIENKKQHSSPLENDAQLKPDTDPDYVPQPTCYRGNNSNLCPSQEIHKKPHDELDCKKEINFSDWQVSEQLAPDVPLTEQYSEGNEQIVQDLDENQDIIATIFEQINDNSDHNIAYPESAGETQKDNDDFNVSTSAENEYLEQSNESITFIEQQIEVPADGVARKKRRRRRQPGDPPLPPLPKPKKPYVRRYRVRPEHRNRLWASYFRTVFIKVKTEDENRFIQLVRMTRKSFDAIVKDLHFPMLMHKQSVMPDERLAITLLYLAHGMQFGLISEKFKLGRSTIRFIVLQTCEVIWEVLSPTYLRDPTSEDYIHIAEGFKKLWKLPNCVGVLGAKVVPFKTNRIVPGGYKWNEVKAVVAMAACDSKHIFRQIGVTVELHQSHFYKQIMNNSLPLPPGRPLHDDSCEGDFPYFFVGSKAFPQRSNLMRPYGGKNLTGKNSIYNYTIACGQAVSDTSFNILCTMWRVLLTNGAFSIENWDCVLKACIVLHNFVLISDKHRWYQPNGHIKSSWQRNIQSQELSEWVDERFPVNYERHLESVQEVGEESNIAALAAREVLADFFCIEEDN